MKLVRQTKERAVFALTELDRIVLLALLKMFPMSPLTHSRRQLSRTSDIPDAEANQRLLEESLRQQQNEGLGLIKQLFDGAKRFKPVGKSFQLRVSWPEVELLLQVLNDVRIGCWLALEAPEPNDDEKLLNDRKTAHLAKRMQLAGLFEMYLLSALDGNAV